MARQRHRNGSRPGANVGDAGPLEPARQLNNLLHQVLGFRTRNQHFAIDFETQPVELSFARDVLNGLSGKAAFQPARENRVSRCAGRVSLSVRDQPGQICAWHIVTDRMKEQRLRIATRALGVRPLRQRAFRLGQQYTNCL